MIQHESIFQLTLKLKESFKMKFRRVKNYFLTKIKTLEFFSLKAYNFHYPVMIFPGTTFHTVTQQEELKGILGF